MGSLVNLWVKAQRKAKKGQRFLSLVYIIGCCLALPLHARLFGEGPRTGPMPQRLVIALDGVPYQTMAALRAEGRFRSFHDPARMIATFPSLTNPAMIEILHVEDSPGYEDHYFDRRQNRLVGGIPDRLRRRRFIQGTFRETFEYHAPAFEGALAYVAAPVGAMVIAQADLAGFRRAFHASHAPVFAGYIGETDTLAHIGGEERLKSFLRNLDRTVAELIQESGGRLQVEMFSDHSNLFSQYRRVELNDAIKRAGFTTEKSLTLARSVVLPKYGLVGCSVLFTAPEYRRELAEACAPVAGVDFAAYQDGNTITLVSRRGRALISRVNDRYKYEAPSGDPLDLSGIVEQLRACEALDPSGFTSAADWLQATRDHQYVDPLRRIFDGFNAHVRNGGDVIVSFEDGYYLGHPLLDMCARLQATHGNLLRGESEGFAISTRQELGSAVCGYELHRVFEFERLRRADRYFGESAHCHFGLTLAQLITGD